MGPCHGGSPLMGDVVDFFLDPAKRLTEQDGRWRVSHPRHFSRSAWV